VIDMSNSGCTVVYNRFTKRPLYAMDGVDPGARFSCLRRRIERHRNHLSIGPAGQRTEPRSKQAGIERLIREEYRGASLVDRGLLARRLITLVHGLGAHSALDPKHWSPAKQRRIIEQELRSLPAMQLREDGPPVRSHPIPARRGAKERTQ
jgi:hypothetical protein